MRVAIAGKGGAGKTTIAATLARLVARGGRAVVALDADSNPNLAAALGLPDEHVVGALPATLVSRRHDGPALTDPVESVLDQHATVGPDGVRLALMGAPAHAGEGCLCAAHATIGAILTDLGERPEVVTVVDLEASPEHLSRGTARHADVLLLVTEPYYRSLETVRRMAGLAAELPIRQTAIVANKVRRPADGEAIDEFCARHELNLVGQLPWSDGVLDADAAGVPLVDHRPGDPVVTAVTQLLKTLLTPDRHYPKEA
jgi:CO dehydrogenase maturation factor